MFKPTKKNAMSWSDACQGSPRALTISDESTNESLLKQIFLK